MPNPKRQHSVQRQRKRRTHFKISAPNLSVCANCQKPVISHRICPFCGHYKGQMIVDMTPEVKEVEPKK
ncbi:MAG: 50S ribosomal protein L32 [Candidatus Omnitrophica bacterium]|nr:50S ribosomal protein L32 [Candidatus Omnitrophota bacterium]